jgi:glycosyltransferase involved in cell wall biosynthesis
MGPLDKPDCRLPQTPSMGRRGDLFARQDWVHTVNNTVTTPTIAIVGRTDNPTDAVEDYCRLLGEAFRQRGFAFELTRIAWDEDGWLQGLWNLWRRSAGWKRRWVLVQYTALMWSRRGFPLRFLLVLGALRIRQVRIAVVFHDPDAYGGTRLVDRVRRTCQRLAMRWSYHLSDSTILTVPLEQVSWLPGRRPKAAFIQIFANLAPLSTTGRFPRSGNAAKTITVFAITDAGDTSHEVADIALAARTVAEKWPGTRLVTVGRGSAESAPKFREALQGSSVEFTALGILPADEVSQVIADSDVSLFVRGTINTQRGSAIASIANAIPLVAYSASVMPGPLAEAGVMGVPFLDSDKLAEATVRVLGDPQLWSELSERSRLAHLKYFSCEAVANRFWEVLHLG